MIGSKLFSRFFTTNQFKLFQTRYHSSAKVFVNKNTRVICQGLTGKHVIILIDCINYYDRELSILNKHQITELIWSEESPQKKQAPSIQVYLFLLHVNKPKKLQIVMLQSFMSPLLSLKMQSWKQLNAKSLSLFVSLKAFLSLIWLELRQP